MERKKNQRWLVFKYEFDRLSHKKMEQVYDILFSKVLIDSKEKEEELEVISGRKK